jgi:hypothetical protein
MNEPGLNDMNDKLQQRLILIGIASFSLAMSACDLGDQNIGETGETGEAGDGDGETGDGDGDTSGDTSGDGDGDCTSPDPNVSFSVESLEFGLAEFESANIVATCTVVTAEVVERMYLELDCPEFPNPVIIDITATPTLSVPVLVGDTIQVRYIRVVTAWIETYLSLETESDEFLFSLVDAESLFLPPGVDVGTDNQFTWGVAIASAYLGCSVQVDQCGDLERVLLGFDHDGEVPWILDGSYIEITPSPTVDVWLVEAQQVEDPDAVEDPQACVDTPTGWYRMLVAAGQP